MEELHDATDEEKENIWKMLRDNSIIARVANSSERIYWGYFGDFCQKAYEHHVESFPWLSITPTFHRGCSHFAEAIELNDGYGLGQLTEGALEASHKLLR